MRIGVLGVGRIGASHADVVAQHPAVTSLVIADVDAARAAEVAERLGADAAPTVEAAFAGVDGVVIASATGSHADLIVAGADAGVPVFCEKPVALDIPGTRRVQEAVSSAGIPVQIGFQRRFDPGYVAAKEAVASGRIGGLRRLHAITADPTPPPGVYLATSGGLYRDCLVHDFDIIRWVTGREVVDVIALGANRGAPFIAEAGDIDEVAVLLTLDDGTLGTVQGSRYNGAGYDVRLEVAGTEGTVAVGLDDRSALTSTEPGVGFPAGTAHPNFWSRFEAAYAAEINTFIDVIRGAPSPCTVDEALEALYVAEAATLSWLEGRHVKIEEVRK